MLAPLMEFQFNPGQPGPVSGNSGATTVIQGLRGLETPLTHLIWLLAILLAPLALH
jgi:hypothetical protein